jgi:hypothetical protein
LTQTRPWTNPYLQRNTQAEQQPTNTVKPPTTEEWLKDNIMLRAIETRQAQLQQIQAKLTVGEPGDKYEQEADMMASQVMSMPDTPVQTKPLANGMTRVVQRAAMPTNGGTQANSNIESRLNSTKGGGSPLPKEVRSFMEPRFGADFSSVRVHTDSTAVQMSRELGAQAFTHGSDVYFGEGKAPGNNELTAHELTHVVQQTFNIQRKLQANQLDGQPLLQISSASTSIQLASEQNHTSVSKESNHHPSEDEARNIGQEALQKVGYEKIIETALRSGFLRTIESNESATIQTKLQANQDTIFRQAAAAGQVFTKYAVTAGIASQLDSPAPGPADLVALGILMVGLVRAGYVLMTSEGNVADSGIMEEARALIEAAKAAGQKLTICEALAQLMSAAQRAKDKAKIRKIKGTQKYHGCRHSRHS